MTGRMMDEGQAARVAPEQRETPALTIRVVSGVGFGPTKLAAFDAALREAGIADRNLMTLSSIIPAGSTVLPTAGGNGTAPGEWGDRLYVVLAQLRVDTRHEEGATMGALGWALAALTCGVVTNVPHCSTCA